jgi:hypothetical protein
VRQQHHCLCAFFPNFFDAALKRRFLDAEGPVRNEMARIGDRRVRECLADDRHRHAVDRAQRIGIEHRVFEIRGAHVLRQHLDRRGLDRLLAVGEFPVRRHVVGAEEPLRAAHVLAAGPQRRGRALPAVAAVEQQRMRPRGAQALDQRRKMREAADLAVAPGQRLELEVRTGVRQRAASLQAVLLQGMLAHRVVDIDARLAEIHRQELRVRVRDVQQRDVAERRHVVQLGGSLGLASARAQRRACSDSDG